VFEEPAVKDDFGLAESSIREGAELAKQYLQLTKLYEPHFAPTRIEEVLKEVAASVRAFARELGMPAFEACQSFAPDLPVRDLDGAQLKMAFFNLGKNAAEALKQCGTVAPRVTFSCVVDGAKLRIVVSDNGPGMPREIAENLFVPFKTKKEGGTGLGLTICKKIIDIHGGFITCQTGADGTSFVVTV
jgi:signal transduction histidine kinase